MSWQCTPGPTITAQRTAIDFAKVIRDRLEVRYPNAEKVILVMDNRNTHKPAALYHAFEPAVARSLSDHLEIHHTPQHGSWLNMAEIKLSILSRQCLDRRIPDLETLTRAVATWEQTRKTNTQAVNGRFTTPNPASNSSAPTLQFRPGEVLHLQTL